MCNRKGRALEEGEFFMKDIRRLPFLPLGLCLSAHTGAQAGVALRAKTDMDCYWKLDGRPMRLLNANDSKVVPVSPGEHLIEAKTTNEAATTPIKVEVDQGQNTVHIQLTSQNDQQLKMQHAETAREPAETDAALTWTDFATGLLWTSKDNGSDVNWN